MYVLGIDTSTMVGGVALTDGKRVIGEYTLNIEMTHSERLMPCIMRILGDARTALKDVGGVAVAVGPGSFTGLRIGVATAKGLSYSLGIPVADIVTLDALAFNFPFASMAVCPMIVARRDEVFSALYRVGDDGQPRRISEEYTLKGVNQLLTDLEAEPGDIIFTGDGACKHRIAIEARLGARAHLAPKALGFVRSAVIAELGAVKIGSGETGDAFTLRPLYLRKSEAEARRERGTFM